MDGAAVGRMTERGVIGKGAADKRHPTADYSTSRSVYVRPEAAQGSTDAAVSFGKPTEQLGQRRSVVDLLDPCVVLRQIEGEILRLRPRPVPAGALIDSARRLSRSSIASTTRSTVMPHRSATAAIVGDDAVPTHVIDWLPIMLTPVWRDRSEQAAAANSFNHTIYGRPATRGRRLRSSAVRVPGSVKRVTFLLGLAVTIFGIMILNDPAAVGPLNCGTALAPKRFVQGENAGRCAELLRTRRWSGAGVFAAGVIALVLPGGYRCLLVDD